MAAITGTLAKKTEFSGDHKVLILDITPESASDTVTLTAATHKVSEIIAVMPQLTAGHDAALADITATYSGLVITVLTWAAAGTVATDWTGATARLVVIAR